MSNPTGERYLEIEDVGDVAVIRFLNGWISKEEGVEQTRREFYAIVDEAKRNKVIIDMSGLVQLGSPLLGPLITLQRKLHRMGGQLAFCNIDPFMDVFQITKLDKFFRIYSTLGEAFEEIVSGEDDLSVACPAFGCAGLSSAHVARVGSEIHLRCPKCDIRYQFVLPEVHEEEEVSAIVTALWLPTYRGQEVRLVPGPPRFLQLPGRLDLFAADALRQLWESIPRPRRVVIDCRRIVELSEQGVSALLELLDEKHKGGRGVLLVNRNVPVKGATIPPGIPLSSEEPESVRALGELPPGAECPITVRIVRRREP